MPPTQSTLHHHPGLPKPASVVQEFTVISQQSTPIEGVEPAQPETFRILRTTEMDAYDPPVPEGPEGLQALAPAPKGDAYHGTSRKAAKLSIVQAAVENFADLQLLLNSLTPDSVMIHHTPPISDNSTSTRVAEEERNVQVRAFLYAAKHEPDNDFHLIVGRDRNLAPHLYMTMELSGLPTHTSASYVTLKAVRDAFKAYFGNNLPGMSYDFYDPPRPIVIQGSLLFDIHHAKGPHPGPPSLKSGMHTIWEVHPVTSIVFEA